MADISRSASHLIKSTPKASRLGLILLTVRAAVGGTGSSRLGLVLLTYALLLVGPALAGKRPVWAPSALGYNA